MAKRTSSQSEGYSSKWLIWLVCREPLQIYMQAHLSDFVIFLQCVLDVGLLNTRIAEKTGCASGLGEGDRGEGRKTKNSRRGTHGMS